MNHGHASVDLSLLERVTDQLVCSRCLLDGVRSPVTQVVSKYHRPRTLCPRCRTSKLAGPQAIIYRLRG